MTKVEQGILINTQHQNNVTNNIPEEISFKDQILNPNNGDSNRLQIQA